MRFGRSRVPHEASFDLTPLVDVVLLLLIFFTMTMHFAKTQQTPVDLPQEPGEKGKPGQVSITVDIMESGEMIVLGSAVQMPELLRMVQAEAQSAGPGVELVVRAERTAPARHLNLLADALAGIGIKQWKLATSGGGGG